MSHIYNQQLPSVRDANYNHQNFVDYLKPIHIKNKNSSFAVIKYINNIVVSSTDMVYCGGVYSPFLNRIYFIPFTNASSRSKWHYIDCNTGTVVEYTHGATVVDQPYQGGIFSPIQNRIYMTPYAQSNQSTWHYIDGYTGNVVAYNNGLSSLPVQYAYSGGCYCPILNRIYFTPVLQANQSTWHYIDCNTGNVVEWVHGQTVGANYVGAVYSPTQNRIYFVPQGMANPIYTQWHYIDCNTGNAVAYTHGATTVTNAYQGGVYSPTQNRIYFIPRNQATQSNWHYVDCSNGNIVAYAHGLGATAVTDGNRSGVYLPTSNKILFVPYGQGAQSNWIYIDCNTGNVGTYVHNSTVQPGPYFGGVYAPTLNRIYFVPYGMYNQTYWHYIQELSTPEISPSIGASPLFNKY